MLRMIKYIVDKFSIFDSNTLSEYRHLYEFIEKNSLYVSQVTLFTYIKTRAGTQWPKLFENEDYLTSLRIARWHIFIACVSDLSIFIAAQFHINETSDTKICRKIAIDLFSTIVRNIEQNDIDKSIFETALIVNERRCATVNFIHAFKGDYAFQTSAQALLDWAPVVDSFKKSDAAIVRNSIHLRWINVRQKLLKKLQNDSIIREINLKFYEIEDMHPIK